tara:strand:- start:32 stop:202 length:171 start_codon:yes stop_codon:yes gene_type:complete
MMTEQDLDRQNFQQAIEEVQKEKERLELNIFCSDKSVPEDVKAEAIISFQTRHGRL